MRIGLSSDEELTELERTMESDISKKRDKMANGRIRLSMWWVILLEDAFKNLVIRRIDSEYGEGNSVIFRLGGQRVHEKLSIGQ